MLAGQTIDGGSLSTIVTVKVHCVLLLFASVSMNVFVVMPFGKVDPLGSPAV
jgi:hypothetical protein